MTDNGIKTLHDSIHTCAESIMEKIKAVKNVKPEMTLDEIYKIADIIKDVSEIEKNLAKTHYLYSEHSEQKF